MPVIWYFSIQNFIELFWGAAKRYTRENCEYSLKGLRTTIPEALEVISRASIWRYYNKFLRLAYQDGHQYGAGGGLETSMILD